MIKNYWHSEGKYWVRFVHIEGAYEAEISKTDPIYPSLSLPWVKAEDQDRVWPVYHEGDLVYFQIYQNQLYHTDGRKNAITQDLQISLADEEGFIEHVNRGNLPSAPLFTGDFSSVAVEGEIDTSKLPLTPEEQANLWAEIQNKNIGENLSEYWDSISTFQKQQTETLLEDLRREMVLHPRSSFSTVHEYLAFLDSAFEPETPLYEQIENSYSTTDFDRRYNIQEDHEILVLRKKNVYEGIIKKEIEAIKNQFGMHEPPLVFVQSEDSYLSDSSKNNVTDAPAPVNLVASDSEGSESDVNLVPSDSEEDESEVKLVPSDSEEDEPDVNPVSSDSEEDEPALVQGSVPAHTLTATDIRNAVKDAQKKYSDWYQGKSQLRGPKGFFTRFRHSNTGQRNAKDFTAELKDCSYDELIDKINSFLTADERRYHRHSFASFLLDELKKLSDSPWKSIPCDEKQLYDKEEVKEQLSSQKGPQP